MDKLIKKHFISNYECDKNSKLRVVSLFNLLQDMADTHAEILNIGSTFCYNNNVAWIGRSYHVKINRLPKASENITLETWPSAKTGLIATREFCIKDNENKVLVIASSQWAMINRVNGKPIKFEDYNLSYDVLNERALETSFNKIQKIDNITFQKQIQLRNDDIDYNGHVNNCIYPMLATEALNLTKDIQEIEINYKKPTFIQDEYVDIKIQQNIDNSYLIQIDSKDKTTALLIIK